MQAALLRVHVIAGGQESAGHQLAPRRLGIVAGPLAQPLGVHRPRFGHHVDALHGGEILQARQLYVAHHGAFALQYFDYLVQRRGNFRMGNLVGLVEVTHEADAQPAHAAVEIGAEIAVRNRRTARVLRIVSGEHVERQRDVAHRARHRPDMVERKRERKYAAPRHQPISRLEADHTASPRGIAN